MLKVSWVVNTSGMVNDSDRGKSSKTGQDRRRRSAQTGMAVIGHQRQHPGKRTLLALAPKICPIEHPEAVRSVTDPATGSTVTVYEPWE
ncbi:hypothetical protein [Roseateles puraquae]|uniref:hypothetical protein n=1 Tax=Roseateles puraquae TaxID=431059 RepID=UPI0011864467|nr:hypothetical protein [Roseateles puraquae]MDG0852214.1 hypothetical protein [Roseateles puraquae]